MINRGKILIDRKFQLTTTFKIMSMSFISIFAITALISISAMQNGRKLNRTIQQLNEVMTTEENIINAFIDYSRMIETGGLMIHTKKISEDHGESMKKIRSNIKELDLLITHNIRMLIIIVALIIIFGITLYLYLINFTHRISGPVYVMQKQIAEILEGKNPEYRRLRDNDELKELYEKFTEFTEKYHAGR